MKPVEFTPAMDAVLLRDAGAGRALHHSAAELGISRETAKTRLAVLLRRRASSRAVHPNRIIAALRLAAGVARPAAPGHTP